MADNDAASSTIGLDAGDDVAAVGKIDVTRDGTPSSMESTPEADGGMEATQEPTAQPQKRKGGRKPVSFSDLIAYQLIVTNQWQDLCDV